MSATTTKTTTATNPQTLRLVLADYELHHSGPQTTSPPANSAETVASPANWPTDYRRVPPYRPVNRNLDPNERIVYNNRGEQMFITTMFFGIRVVTAFHRTWRATGGKINDRFFRYDIGGEY